MSKEVVLNLPNPELMTDADRAVYEEFAARPLDQFALAMPGTVQANSTIPEFATKLVDLRGKNEGDSSRAIVVPLPFGNPYSEAMDIRVRAIQAFMPEDTRILVFPNNTTKETYYSFDKNKQNDGLEELSHHVLRACKVLRVSEVAIAGYSQGASLGPQLMMDAESYDIGVTAAYLGDPANVVQRTPGKLKREFIGTGMGNLNRAINDSGIQALSEAQHSRGGFDTLRQLATIPSVAKSGSVFENVALHEAMTNGNFAFEIDAIINNGFDPRQITIARMADSKVCRPELEADIATIGQEGSLQIVKGYGHEGGDNVIDNALRIRAAFERAGFWQQRVA
ncbi:hypothetical protein KDA00_02615 [Candidatus Saccharibacteria bacterium]|nr:hypothetical protein [Candidatus Saccharibacteria bacterium]